MRVLQNKQLGTYLIASVTITVLISTFLLDPIAQDPAYHQFKDSRSLLGIANFCNVVSSFAFLVVGVLGLYKILITKSLIITSDFKIAYLLLFASLSLVALGSGYYHVSPDNKTLVWDRLPMAVGFMSLFSIIIYEFISTRFGRRALLPAILTGIFSVIYWGMTENRGAGDLRLYILVQFLPILLTPIILVFFGSRFSHVTAYWWLFLAYLLAKLFEHFDSQIFIITGIISGHSLKHLAAATGFYLLLKSYENRQLADTNR